jgi:integrase/recombinase XerD
MRDHAHAGMTHYGSTGSRKYLNAAERRRFSEAALRAPPEVQLFCIVLNLTGGRISEILALTPAAIDIDSAVANIVTLKRRKRGVVRQVPLPRSVVRKLDQVFHLRPLQRHPDSAHRRIWKWSGTTAWRRVKEIMAIADLSRTAAMPKGLQHGFGVNATANLVPQHFIQRWLGYASPKTTAIYCDVCGPDERACASRMWRGFARAPTF